MNTVTVERAKVIETLKINRDKHHEIFKDAQAGYRKVVISILDKAIQEAREGKKIRTFFDIEAPKDHTEEYDQAIKMLEWSIDKNITLDRRSFINFVLDDWGWKQDFLSISQSYSTSASQSG